jgi:asparagine synthase (glutamine-hydrolysing)
VHVLFHGDLHDDGPRHAVRDAGSEAGAAAIIAAEYAEREVDSIERIAGAYCLAIADTTRRRLVLASDTIGSYPLYWTLTPHGLVFASELSAVLRHPSVRKALDAEAVADYVAFGMPLGERTLAADIHLLGPGSTLVYDWDSGRLEVRQPVGMAAAFRPWQGNRADYTEALCDTFAASVRRALAGSHTTGLSLSGGLDSRAILGQLNGQGRRISTHTLGVKGCADEVIAARLASIAGTRHTFFELDDRYLHDFLPNLARMVSLTDGMYLSHGLTEMLALQFLSSADISILVRGHGGELAKTDAAWPLHTDDRVRSFTSSSQLLSYLLARLNYVGGDVQPADIFTESWARRMEGVPRRSLEAAVAGVALGPSDLCSYLYLSQHHRRCTVASLELFRQAVDVRLPFVDQAFLGVLFQGAPEWRADTTIHRAVTRAGNAALLRVRNSNTGAPADASAFTERALDKVNSLLKRLNVHGYRHYHNFQAWMQAELLSSVERVLLAPASLDRGVLREAGVRRLLDDTRHGRSDHSYLLQVLLLLELWQQEHL